MNAEESLGVVLLSKKGRNLNGRKLDEDNFGSNMFLCNDRIYKVGNRYHNLVEGYGIDSGEFIDTFYMEDIRIIKIIYN
jgi:hypothetical protein